MSSPIDLSQSDFKELQMQLGQLLWMCLKKSKTAAVFVLREDDHITILDPSILASVGDEQMAIQLLEAGWTGDQIEEFFERRDSA